MADDTMQAKAPQVVLENQMKIGKRKHLSTQEKSATLKTLLDWLNGNQNPIFRKQSLHFQTKNECEGYYQTRPESHF